MQALLPASLRPWAVGAALAFGVVPTPARAASRAASAPDVVLRFCRARCGPPFRLQVADTPRAHARGLMGVTSLPPRGGMLFVFGGPAPRDFWMKDTPLALDLVFVGADCRVLGVVRGATPLDERALRVEGASQYVVEVAAGAAAAVGPGDRVLFRAEAGRSGPVDEGRANRADTAAPSRPTSPR